MGIAKTHDDFVDELKIKNPNIVSLEKYKGAHFRIKFLCLHDNYEWVTSPHSILRGSGCPRCNKKEKLTTESFKLRIAELHPNIVVLGDYVNTDTPVLCRCTLDGFEWSPRPHHILHGVGCPRCAGVANKTTSEFVRVMLKDFPHIEIIGEYINNKTLIDCRCKACGHNWKATPNALLKGKSSCPSCNKTAGEARIMMYLQSRGVEFIFQYRFPDCKDILTLPFDFYLPDQNIVIEYDGQQHFMPVNFGGRSDDESVDALMKTQNHDFIKTEYCKDRNIKLVRVPYTDFNEIENILDKHLL